MAAKRSRNEEVLKDYNMLGKISAQLRTHERLLHNVVSKRVARKTKTDLEEGILENLDIVATHMRKARAEVEKARHKLKMI
jgi:hypothetical protein